MNRSEPVSTRSKHLSRDCFYGFGNILLPTKSSYPYSGDSLFGVKGRARSYE